MGCLRDKLDEAGQALDMANGIYDTTLNIYDETDRTTKNLMNVVKRRTSGQHQKEHDLVRLYGKMTTKCINKTVLFCIFVIFITILLCVFI